MGSLADLMGAGLISDVQCKQALLSLASKKQYDAIEASDVPKEGPQDLRHPCTRLPWASGRGPLNVRVDGIWLGRGGWGSRREPQKAGSTLVQSAAAASSCRRHL